MADPPFALFMTWTTYATGLPGDARGYVSNTLNPAGGFHHKENEIGSAYTKDDTYTRERARLLQQWPAVWLTAQQAGAVASSLVAAATRWNWRILRAVMPITSMSSSATAHPTAPPSVAS